MTDSATCPAHSCKSILDDTENATDVFQPGDSCKACDDIFVFLVEMDTFSKKLAQRCVETDISDEVASMVNSISTVSQEIIWLQPIKYVTPTKRIR